MPLRQLLAKLQADAFEARLGAGKIAVPLDAVAEQRLAPAIAQPASAHRDVVEEFKQGALVISGKMDGVEPRQGRVQKVIERLPRLVAAVDIVADIDENAPRR